MTTRIDHQYSDLIAYLSGCHCIEVFKRYVAVTLPSAYQTRACSRPAPSMLSAIEGIS